MTGKRGAATYEGKPCGICGGTARRVSRRDCVDSHAHRRTSKADWYAAHGPSPAERKSRRSGSSVGPLLSARWGM